MFCGTYNHSVDSAGRFVLPKKMRNQLDEDFVITKGLGCLYVFPKDYVNLALTPALRKLNDEPIQALLNPHIVRLTRHFFSGMVTTNDDSQNRVPLTQEHREYAGIEDEVVICGCGEYVELWGPKALQEYRATNDNVADLMASGAAVQPLLSQPPQEQAHAGVSQAGTGQ